MPFSAIAPAVVVRPRVTTIDATPTKLFSIAANNASGFAIVHVRKQGVAAETHTFTLQGNKSFIEANHLVVNELIHQTGSTGSPTPSIAWTLNGSDELELTVTGVAATTVVWEAQVFSIKGD